MRPVDIQRASAGNPALREALENVYSNVETLQAQVAPPTGPPPACQFTVGGVDGTFIIDITNPQDRTFVSVAQRNAFQQNGGDVNALNATVSHQLRSSKNRSFDVTGDARTYGPDSKIRWEITDTPDETRYWQLRSSYDGGQTFNAWQDFKDPVLCGIVPVWSQVVRSVRQMPNAQLNVTNYATVDTIPEMGGTFTIRVYGIGGPNTGWVRQVGASFEGLNGVSTDQSKVVPFPAAILTGFATGTYDVYYDKVNKLFRVFAFPAQYAQTLADIYRFAGRITTGTTGGVDAVITLTLAAGNVVSAVINNGGSDYTSPPTLTVVGDGAGATLTCTIVGGSVSSVTITAAGAGYTVATVTVSGGKSSTTGGGGGGGTTGGCVEVGTVTEQPEGTIEEVLPCSEWVVLDFGNGPVKMHPDTLVSVFKKARELTLIDRIEVKGARWKRAVTISDETRESYKVKRTCPGGTYLAGPDGVRLHNMKILPE